MEFKLIVAGGRDFNDYFKASQEIVRLADNELSGHLVSIVSGMARGADALGVKFAQDMNVILHKFPADWDTHGRSAGPIRNEQMGDFADGLLAFHDGKSRGTAHMIGYMRHLKKSVRVINY